MSRYTPSLIAPTSTPRGDCRRLNAAVLLGGCLTAVWVTRPLVTAHGSSSINVGCTCHGLVGNLVMLDDLKNSDSDGLKKRKNCLSLKLLKNVL